MSTDGSGVASGPVARMRLEEVREDEAPAGTRAIYAEIRRATGIPQVNLIFRHLARDPAMLAWAWEVVGPLYRSGAVAAAAARLEPALAMPPRPPIWAALDEKRPDEAARLQAVLAFYDRGNRSNLLGLTALLRAAERPALPGEQGARLQAPAPVPGSPALSPDSLVPPLPRRDAVAPETMALVDDLAARHGSASIGVVPSLYLHLTYWPEAVRAAHAVVAPMLGTPEWRRRVGELIAAAGTLADELANELGTTAPMPHDGVASRYLRTVRAFVEGTIPQMALVGRLLSGGKAAGETSSPKPVGR
jgi:hypothetical protein